MSAEKELSWYSQLEIGVEEANKFYNILLKAFSSDTTHSIKRRKKDPKKHDGKYIPNCGSK